MKYKTTNEWNHFDFSQAYISEVRSTLDSLYLVLDNVVILPENSCNRDIRKMRANQLQFTITDANISSFVEEGYKVYDANGNLTRQESNRVLNTDQYAQGFEALVDCTIYSIEKQDSQYEISIDTEDHTFLLVVTGSGDIQEWDKFLNLNSEP
jgi:hypothetical protein